MDAPFRVWLDLNNSSTRWKWRFFWNSILEIFSERTTHFFTRQAKIIFFVLKLRCKCDTPCRVWIDLDTSLNRWKRPSSKFVVLVFRKFPYEIFNFFLEKLQQRISARKVLYVLQLRYTWDNSCQVRLDLNNFITQSKRVFWYFKYSM